MQDIFRAPGSALRQGLQELEQAVRFVFPQKRQHRADLHYAVRDLSRLLTSERDQNQAYWASPRLLGAYLNYFLPWNLVRLAWLLPNLPLNLHAESKILDLGSGPLTLPLGLWLARPDLRKFSLNLFCSDQAPHPLNLGRDILRRLMLPGEGNAKKPEGRAGGALKADPESGAQTAPGKQNTPETVAQAAAAPWQVKLLRAPLEQALRKTGGRVNLITALNVLNELPAPRRQSLEERLAGLFEGFDRTLEPGGQIFLMEPGTRLGGKLVQLMRKLALENGYRVQAPCPHQDECPFLEGTADIEALVDDDLQGWSTRKGRESVIYAEKPARAQTARSRAARSGGSDEAAQEGFSAINKKGGRGWCHFGHAAGGATPELQRLSAAADLRKERLHLAFVLLQKPGRTDEAGRKAAEQKKEAEPQLRARVISDPIRLPDGIGRYVCTAEGLGLLEHAEVHHSGACLPVKATGKRDPKSGAVVVRSL